MKKRTFVKDLTKIYFHGVEGKMITEAIVKQELNVSRSIPPSAKTVYDLIKDQGPITAKDIQNGCKLAPRTVRYALKILLDAHLIQRLPNLKDMRQNIYRTTN